MSRHKIAKESCSSLFRVPESPPPPRLPAPDWREEGDAVAIGEGVIEGACSPIDKDEVDALPRDAECFYHPLDGCSFF